MKGNLRQTSYPFETITESDVTYVIFSKKVMSCGGKLFAGIINCRKTIFIQNRCEVFV